MHVVAGRTLKRRNADYGNALLSRFPGRRSASIDLTVAQHEPRNAIDVRIRSTALRCASWRRTSACVPPSGASRCSASCALRAAPLGARIVMGDVNEWYLWGRPLRWLHDRFAIAHAPATFPARRPMLKLDRIWAHPAGALPRLQAHRSALARIASDHLPLVASFAIA